MTILEPLIRLRLLAILALIAAFTLILAILVPPHALAQAPNAPVITVTSVGNATAVQIVGANPSRRGIIICTATQNIWFAPVNPAGMTAVTPAVSTGVLLTTASPGPCWSPPYGILNAGSAVNVGAAFFAIAATGTATVSVLEF